jgi:Flp pilus assembly pilin Flp
MRRNRARKPGTKEENEMVLRWPLRGSNNEKGQALVEYALILGLIALVAIGSLTLIGENLLAFLEYLSDQILAVAPGS